jgi:hypothetical protein
MPLVVVSSADIRVGRSQMTVPHGFGEFTGKVIHIKIGPGGIVAHGNLHVGRLALLTKAERVAHMVNRIVFLPAELRRLFHNLPCVGLEEEVKPELFIPLPAAILAGDPVEAFDQVKGHSQRGTVSGRQFGIQRGVGHGIKSGLFRDAQGFEIVFRFHLKTCFLIVLPGVLVEERFLPGIQLHVPALPVFLGLPGFIQDFSRPIPLDAHNLELFRFLTEMDRERHPLFFPFDPDRKIAASGRPRDAGRHLPACRVENGRGCLGVIVEFRPADGQGAGGFEPIANLKVVKF